MQCDLLNVLFNCTTHKHCCAYEQLFKSFDISQFCLSGDLSAILNERLTSYLEINNLLNINQAGFRKKHSTSDGMFLLHTLAEMYKRKNMKSFCCFIDFQKAFDSVWRAGLWAKMWNYNVHGNFFYCYQKYV